MSARAPDRAEVQAKLIAALQRHGVVIKLLTGRMVVQRHNPTSNKCVWFWYGDVAGDNQTDDNLDIYVLAAAVLDQCGTRAVLAALEGEGG